MEGADERTWNRIITFRLRLLTSLRLRDASSAWAESEAGNPIDPSFARSLEFAVEKLQAMLDK